jgi:hypothetical protein
MMEYLVRRVICQHQHCDRAHVRQSPYHEYASREVHRSGYLHSHADATRSSAGLAD